MLSNRNHRPTELQSERLRLRVFMGGKEDSTNGSQAQRSTFWSGFSPSTFMWVSEIKLISAGFPGITFAH